jgi:hypothetical protein
MAGYEREVEELRMRQEAMEAYMRMVEERLERERQRCCSDVQNGEIPFFPYH